MKNAAELVVALDVPSEERALELAQILSGHVKWLKIGLQLFVSCGPGIVRKLRETGFEIFLDLKFYDIPHTVANAVKAACSLDIGMLTIHAQGGEKMCKAALEASFQNSRPPIIACVTALTSFAEGEMPGIEASPAQYACYLASRIVSWGMRAIVCSPQEARQISREWPQLKCVCPGIRPSRSSLGDQKRTLGPAEASANGADFLVVGRPILEAEHPQKAIEAILREMREAREQAEITQ